METAPDGRPGRRQGEGGRGRLELGLPAAAAGGGGREGLTISPSAALLREAREGEAREGEEGPISPPANALSPVPVTSRSCDSRYHSPPPSSLSCLSAGFSSRSMAARSRSWK